MLDPSDQRLVESEAASSSNRGPTLDEASAPAALADKEEEEDNDDDMKMRKCAQCGLLKPCEEYGKKYIKKMDKWYLNGQCLRCENAIESFSKRMKKSWGDLYQKKMKALKADGKKYDEMIADEVRLNKDRVKGSKRKACDGYQALNRQEAGNRETQRVILKPFTKVAYIKWASEDAGGGLTEDEAAQKWTDRSKVVGVRSLGQLESYSFVFRISIYTYRHMNGHKEKKIYIKIYIYINNLYIYI